MLSLVSAKALDASKPTTVMTSGIIAINTCGYVESGAEHIDNPCLI